MKTTRPGNIANPELYKHFKTASDIARVINRSRSYVFKALKTGFTEREEQMLRASIERLETE